MGGPKRDLKRDAYVFDEYAKGRTFGDIGKELGLSQVRIRRLYVREKLHRQGKYATDVRERKKAVNSALLLGEETREGDEPSK